MMNVFIFLAGLAVYAGYGLPGLCYLAVAVLLSYGVGLLTKRFRWTMWISVGANALMLVLLKLRPVTGMELISALGVSYFSLQLIRIKLFGMFSVPFVCIWQRKWNSLIQISTTSCG